MAPIANIFASRKCKALLVAALLGTLTATADPTSAEAVVRHRAMPVVIFTAGIDAGMLVVNAEIAPDWHIYAMDNLERAQEKTGKEKPDCELPTQFEIKGPVELTGDWRQTPPADLSNPEIYWYTWGFEKQAAFAIPIKITAEGPITITINGQACNASSCSMIQDLTLTVDPATPNESNFNIDSLLPLQIREDD